MYGKPLKSTWLRRNCCTLRYWKAQLSASFLLLMTWSAVSSVRLLTKILQLIRAAAGMQWKNISLLPLLFPLSLRFPSTPPSSLDYITLVCEHSSQHSFSWLTIATLTPRLHHTLSFPLAERRLQPPWYWLNHSSLRSRSLSAHVDVLSYWHTFPLQGEREEWVRRDPGSPQTSFKVVLNNRFPRETFPRRLIACNRKLAMLHNSTN